MQMWCHLCVDIFWNSMQISLHSKSGWGAPIVSHQMMYFLEVRGGLWHSAVFTEEQRAN